MPTHFWFAVSVLEETHFPLQMTMETEGSLIHHDMNNMSPSNFSAGNDFNRLENNIDLGDKGGSGGGGRGNTILSCVLDKSQI